MQRIVYFINGHIPTDAEKEQIENLNKAAGPRFKVFVSSREGSCYYGGRVKECDMVSGNPPDTYKEIKPYIDADNIPPEGLAANQATVIDKQVFSILPSSGDGAAIGSTVAYVASNILKGMRLETVQAIVKHGQKITLDSGEVIVLSVARNNVTARFM